MKLVLVIPARYESSRFPGKPLLMINGESMIKRVYDICLKSFDVESIYVATDDERILSHCYEEKIKCLMTSKKCLTGTDRVAEVSKVIDADFYINVQGDEPVFNYKDIDVLVNEVLNNPEYEVFCGYSELTDINRLNSKDTPKLVINDFEELLYISRSLIPGSKSDNVLRGFRQICAYAFSKKSLELFDNKKTYLEEIEDIEILRFIEKGIKVKMVRMSQDSIPIDREEDLNRVLNYLNNV